MGLPRVAERAFGIPAFSGAELPKGIRARTVFIGVYPWLGSSPCALCRPGALTGRVSFRHLASVAVGTVPPASGKVLDLPFRIGEAETVVLLSMPLDGGNFLAGVFGQKLHLG